MLERIIKLVLQILELAPRYLVSLAIAAAFLLFGSENWLKRIGVYDFTQNNRQWVGLALVVFTILFIVNRSIPIINWTRDRIAKAKRSKRVLQRLHSLTEDEKEILRFYITKKTKTNRLYAEDGVVVGLETAGIIYRASPLGTASITFAYNIPELVWDYLQQNPCLLTGITRKYRTDVEEFEQ
jgi:hypothetical protein